jgi:uncharacterized protein GlcG (DUF336 family)
MRVWNRDDGVRRRAQTCHGRLTASGVRLSAGLAVLRWGMTVILASILMPLSLAEADEPANSAQQRSQLLGGTSKLRHSEILEFAVAERIAKAFYSCAERKNKPRSIHIIDQFGNTVYAGRMDGQMSDNIEVARMKAQSALYFRQSTEVWLERGAKDPLVAGWIAQLGQFTSPVGLPIIVNGQLVGAIGMGGASGDCAREALVVVLGPQPPPESST